MSFVTSEEMMKEADKNGYAIGAFNVENMEMVMAVIKACEELRSPAILQTTPSTVKYAGLDMYYANVATAAKKASVPIALHLDHGSSFELAMQALRAGYTSIMIDGSHDSFEENIAVSKRVADACRPNGVPVEAELGKVGGKEDDLECDDPGYTDPDDAVKFVNETGITSLAVAIGTAHGIYKGEPKLDFDRLSEIRKVVSIPLVLHGASGVPDESVKECIRRGISKVNFATELRIAYSDGIKAFLKENPDAFDPKKYDAVGMEHVTELVKNKIRVCGSENKA
ncbi:MAG: class II fructose-1,6-bisphosphate aldolase [Lachnospiraceae bacterium]|nr:class II fructose-1,6-bisphosphate aldolase [Lachnospiraceae bacterium]